MNILDHSNQESIKESVPSSVGDNKCSVYIRHGNVIMKIRVSIILKIVTVSLNMSYVLLETAFTFSYVQ